MQKNLKNDIFLIKKYLIIFSIMKVLNLNQFQIYTINVIILIIKVKLFDKTSGKVLLYLALYL